MEPDVNASTKMNFLKQIYVIFHGSEKGLSDVPGCGQKEILLRPKASIFCQCPKEKHHYGTAIAATAIIGLFFAFEMAKHPDVARGIRFELPAPLLRPKFMIFGGQSHRVYLGCLELRRDRARFDL